jgi:hypothetical protein
LEEAAGLGAPPLMQAAPEAEITDFLSRDRFAHAERIQLSSSWPRRCPSALERCSAQTIHA